MGALPIPSPQPAYPHAPYIEELHDFFTVQGVHYGSPADLAPLVERLDDPGLFHEDLRAIVRFILVREKHISRSDVLAIIAVAVGGPLIYRSAQQLRQPLSRLLEFVDGVMRRPTGQPVPVSRAEVIPFPHTAAAPVAMDPAPAPQSRARVWLTSMPRSAVRSLRPNAVASPSFRNALMVAAIAMILLVLLVLTLRPGKAHPAAANVPGGFYVAKPSPFGEAFEPVLRPFLRAEEPAPATFVHTAAGSVSEASSVRDTDPLSPAATQFDSAVTENISTDRSASQPTQNVSPTAQPSPVSLSLSPEFSPARSVNAIPQGVVEPAAPAPGAVPENVPESPAPTLSR